MKTGFQSIVFRHVGEKISQALKGRLPEGSEPIVRYAAYPGDVPVDNLDEVAVEGKVCFVQLSDVVCEICGPGQEYTSEELESPTWLQVAVLAEEMIRSTGNRQHPVLLGVMEGYEPPEDGITYMSFKMGREGASPWHASS